MEEIIKIEFIPVAIVTICPKYASSRNMEATLRGNHKTIVYPSCNGYYFY